MTEDGAIQLMDDAEDAEEPSATSAQDADELEAGSQTVTLQHLIALADTCELLASVFRFPDERLAQGLVDSSLAWDAHDCLVQAGAGYSDAEFASSGLVFAGQNPDDLLETLKRGYSLLFLAPGAEVPVWPYEAAFRHVADGKEGAPILFRAPVTLNVEHMMQQSGVRPVNSRKEPADSVWNEFSYLSYVYGKAAEALYGGDAASVKTWLDQARAFVTVHVDAWLAAFMAKVQVEAPLHPWGAEYAAFGKLGACAVACLSADARGVIARPEDAFLPGGALAPAGADGGTATVHAVAAQADNADADRHDADVTCGNGGESA